MRTDPRGARTLAGRAETLLGACSRGCGRAFSLRTLAALLFAVSCAFAQQPPRPAFEVASIKPNNTSDEGGASSEQVQHMMQTLLEERFKLQLHSEMKEHPLYMLVPAKSGIKVRTSTADCEALAREDPPGQASRSQCGAW